MSALATVIGDGTFTGSDRLDALRAIRGALGSRRAEEIETRPYLPLLAGRGPGATLVGSTLALLGAGGDLAPYGWRIGTGEGRDLVAARSEWEGLVADAAIGLFEYAGPLQVTVLGPATVWAEAHLANGERSVSDPGARRDIPEMLANGLLDRLSRLRDQVPGAEMAVLLREPSAKDAVRGRLTTASGYRRHAPVPADEIGRAWAVVVDLLRSEGIGVTVAMGAKTDLLAAARDARVRELVTTAASLPPLDAGANRAWWELMAGFVESGGRIGFTLGLLDGYLATWRELGFSPEESAGAIVLAQRSGAVSVRTAAASRIRGEATAGVTAADLDAAYRAAERYADRVTGTYSQP